MDLDRVATQAQRQLEAIELIRSWDDGLRDIIRSLLCGSDPTTSHETKACPECGRSLTADRKPTLHYKYAHPDKKVPEDW